VKRWSNRKLDKEIVSYNSTEFFWQFLCWIECNLSKYPRAINGTKIVHSSRISLPIGLHSKPSGIRWASVWAKLFDWWIHRINGTKHFCWLYPMNRFLLSGRQGAGYAFQQALYLGSLSILCISRSDIGHLHWVPHKLSDSQNASQVEPNCRSGVKDRMRIYMEP
jgi:hypothetical protein